MLLTEPGDDVDDWSGAEDDHGVTLVRPDQDVRVIVEIHVESSWQGVAECLERFARQLLGSDHLTRPGPQPPHWPLVEVDCAVAFIGGSNNKILKPITVDVSCRADGEPEPGVGDTFEDCRRLIRVEAVWAVCVVVDRAPGLASVVEGSRHEEVAEAVIVDVRRGEGVAELRGEVVPGEHELHTEQLRVALDEDDHLAGAVGARRPHGVAEELSAVAGGGQEVARRHGHPQVAVLVHGGVLALHRGVVHRLISEQEVLRR